MEAIPLEVGLNLCGEIRAETRRKLLSFARWQCWGCMMASKGDPAKMCVGSRPDGRGCNLVTARYARQRQRA
jgi:hypothetical protein